MDNNTNNIGSGMQNREAPSTGTSAERQGMPVNNNQGNNNKSSVGPIVGSVIVVLVIVLGGLYVYGERIANKLNQEAPIENTTAESDPATAKLEQQGVTDNLGEINADLSASDLNGLDAEIADIDSELSTE